MVAAIVTAVLLAAIVVLAIRHSLIARSNPVPSNQSPHPRFDDHVKGIFVSEIDRQCCLALRAADKLQQSFVALGSLREDVANARAIRESVWLYIHSLLIAASNISKIFWNSKRERISGRGEALRAALGVADDSPLASRKLRNHFEHYDERLDEWALTSKNRNLISDLIGPPSAIQIPTEPKDYHRVVDPSTFTAWFWGDEYPLLPVIKEIQRIRDTIHRS